MQWPRSKYLQDENDGSSRLLAYVRQCKRWGVTPDESVALVEEDVLNTRRQRSGHRTKYHAVAQSDAKFGAALTEIDQKWNTAPSLPSVMPRPNGQVVAVKKVEPLADYKPFPTELLPDVVSHFIDEVAESVGCDHAYVALPLLTALGACVGNARRVVVKRTWYALPTLWTAIVGERAPPSRQPLKSRLHR